MSLVVHENVNYRLVTEDFEAVYFGDGVVIMYPRGRPGIGITTSVKCLEDLVQGLYDLRRK